MALHITSNLEVVECLSKKLSIGLVRVINES